MRNSQKCLRQSNGFTIVELLIVIVVIGILAAIVMNTFAGAKEKATESALKSDLRNARHALEAEFVDTGAYPTEFPDSVKTTPGIGLGLTQVGSASEFCINATAKDFEGLQWFHSSGDSVEAGLCPGELLTGERSVIGDYLIAAPPEGVGDGGDDDDTPSCQTIDGICVPLSVTDHIEANWPDYDYERVVTAGSGYEIRLERGDNEVRLKYNASWTLTSTEERD